MVAGLLAMIACAGALLDPANLEPSSVGTLLGGALLYVWAILYGLGGALIVFGGWWRRTDLEEPGLRMFVAGMAVNGTAILIVRGGAGLEVSGAFVTLAPFAAFGWIAVGRIRDLKRQREAVQRAKDEGRGRGDRTQWGRGGPMAVAPMVGIVVAAGEPGGGGLLYSLFVALIGGGLVSGGWAYLQQRRAAKDTATLTDAQAAKVRAEAGAVLDKRWEAYTKSLEERLATADARVEELERREEECERDRAALAARVDEIAAELARRRRS